MRATMTEAQFTRMVLEYARLHSWVVAHFRPGRTAQGWRTCVQGQGQGFPDIIAVKDRVIVAELKIGRKKPTPEQTLWLDCFRAAGVAAYLWTEKSWPEIERILGGA